MDYLKVEVQSGNVSITYNEEWDEVEFSLESDSSMIQLRKALSFIKEKWWKNLKKCEINISTALVDNEEFSLMLSMIAKKSFKEYHLYGAGCKILDCEDFPLLVRKIVISSKYLPIEFSNSLENFSNLRTLDITDDSSKPLNINISSTYIEILYISGTFIKVNDLRFIHNLTELKKLTFSDCGALTIDVFALIKEMGSLRNLSISNCDKISNKLNSSKPLNIELPCNLTKLKLPVEKWKSLYRDNLHINWEDLQNSNPVIEIDSGVQQTLADFLINKEQYLLGRHS